MCKCKIPELLSFEIKTLQGLTAIMNWVEGQQISIDFHMTITSNNWKERILRVYRASALQWHNPVLT